MYFGGFLLGLLSVGVMKTGVTLVTIWLIWRFAGALRGDPRKLPGLVGEPHREAGRAMVLGLFLFLLSELTCAVELYILYISHPLLRMFHSYASGIGAGLIFWGVFLALDSRVLHYLNQDKPCCSLDVCGGCSLRVGLPCNFHGTWRWFLVFLILLCLPPMFLPVHDLVADPAAVALPFDSWNAFFDKTAAGWLESVIPHWTQAQLYFVIPSNMALVDWRHLPLLALVLSLGAFATSFRVAPRRSIQLAVCAVGVVGFSYMEGIAYGFIPQVYVGSLAHETTELLGLVLLNSFANRFFARPVVVSIPTLVKTTQ
ncbi:MAG: hypothetical protein AUK47_25505 [Deltaproteobacteria bacterium CG2_30_63_29]|nr:MAG: hypothetical protein AUK47_25505 [Deltaproteobacteria bacterium CG2_30_63_29]